MTPTDRTGRLPSLLAASCIAVGLWVLWPSLEAGLFADDFLFQAMMDGEYGAPRHPLDLFNFADGTAQDAAALRSYAIPWWVPDDFKIKMMRPLASALIWFDRFAFGDRIWLAHAHSMLWWLLLMLGVHRLYRDHFTPAVALPALLVFALDVSQRLPVLWLANRGGLVSVALGVWGVLAHLRWREGGAARHALFSAALFSAALLAGEWVFSVFPFVLAYELLQARGTRLRRALALLPATLPALSFLLVRGALGYGAHGSGVYRDPLGQPAEFFTQLWQRLLVFAADMVLDVPSGWWTNDSPWRDALLRHQLLSPAQWASVPQWQAWHVLLGIVSVVLFGLALRASWSGCEPRARATLRWLLLGGALALVPVAGSFPSRRLVLVSMIGVAPALAVILRALLRALLESAVHARRGRFALLWCALPLFLELQVFSPLRQDLGARVRWVRTAEYWVKHAELDPTRVSEQTVVMVTARDFTTSAWFPSTWRGVGHPTPRATHTLSLAPYAHALRRTADNAFQLDVLGGTFLSSSAEQHFRAEHLLMHQGEKVAVGEMTAEIVRMHGHLPRTVEFRFARPLESDAYAFVSAQRGGIVRVEMPEVGEQIILPRAWLPDFTAHSRRRYEARLGHKPEFLAFDPVPDFIEYRPD